MAGSSPAPALAATALASAAKLTPELTEGPYWVNTKLHRSNVLANSHGGGHQRGVPLKLYITARRTNIVAVNGSVATRYAAVFNIAADSAEVDATGSHGRPNAGGLGGPSGPPPTA